MLTFYECWTAEHFFSFSFKRYKWKSMHAVCVTTAANDTCVTDYWSWHVCYWQLVMTRALLTTGDNVRYWLLVTTCVLLITGNDTRVTDYW